MGKEETGRVLPEPAVEFLNELHVLNENLTRLNENLETIAEEVMVVLGTQAAKDGKNLSPVIRASLYSLMQRLGNMLGVGSSWPFGQ